MYLINFGLLWTILFAIHSANGIHKGFLYPHGREVPDKILPPQDDISSPELFLRTPIVFYDEIYQSIFVNSNGILSFMTEIAAFFNMQFPLDYPVIAPLYTNVDVRATGAVYYRESQEGQILERGTRTVRNAFSYARDFEAKSVLIVTWENVGYHKQGADKVNTFQVAVISSDDDTYVEFLYPENGIQWIKGTGTASALPDALAQAGFISADGRMYTLKGSGTDQVLNLHEWSNIGNPGQWLFHVGRVGPEGNVEPPDVELYEENEPPKTCATGVFYCHSKAHCDDYATGFCCICQPGYYGNGLSCLNEEIPVRVNGKVSGVISGVNLTDLDLQAYVVPKDGRSYTALSRVPENIGYDMQSLNILGTTIGWLFAKPVKGAANGYQLTGGVFNQTVTITYPQTGHQLVLKQRFTGLDVFQQLTMTAELNGDIPTIPIGSKITIKDYDEHYTAIGPGHLVARSSQIFQLEGVAVDNTYTVDQNIQYHECEHITNPVTSFRLKVTRNFIGYETENIIRYAMNNKVTPLGVDEDPCREGKSQCGRHSTCVAEGDTFRCVCNPGYQYIISGDIGSCVDVNECSAGTHTCDFDATCINNQGSFYCQCNPGYSGDGHNCKKDLTCQDIRCDYNADCVQRVRNAPQCYCKSGFAGNGTYCVPVDDRRQPEYPTYEPVQPPTSSPHEYDVIPRCILGVCYCPQGYDIDETVRKCLKAGEHPDETSQNENGGRREKNLSLQRPEPICFLPGKCSCPKGYKLNDKSNECEPKDGVDKTQFETKGPSGFKIPCNELNRCHPHAQCVPDASYSFHCECDVGYQGDGYECTVIEGYSPYDEDECSSPIHCVGDADCVLDQNTQKYVCECHQGFIKDPISRACIDENLEDSRSSTCLELNDCHEHAQCLIRPETGDPECVCNPGFEGDGRRECRRSQIGCNVLNNCAAGTAECRYDPAAAGHRCRCKQGYQGDGITCTPILTCLEDRSLCGDHSSCLPSRIGGYSCQCNPGYIGNGQLCKPISDKPGNFLLLNQGNAMIKVPYRPTSGDPGRPILIQPQQQSIGIDIDCAEGRVYWSDINGKKIESATYKGADIKHFITQDVGSVEGLSIDWLSRNIYWTDSTKDTIEVASLDNNNLRKVLIFDGLVNPRGIAVHPSRGKVFWSDWNRESPKIEWANMDGTERGVFISGASVQLPNSLAIDFNTDELCWADAGTKTIECTGIGNRYDRTVARNCSYPFGLAISQDHYYWTDWTTRKIERVTRPGQVHEKPLNIPLVGSSKLYGIVAVPDSCPRLSNTCQHDYGRCPENHLCLPNGAGGRSCVCASGTC